MSFVGGLQGPELRSMIRIKRKRLWVKRIVILDGGFIYYYKSSRDTKPRGILPLSSYTVKDHGLLKGEYILELLTYNQAAFGLAFPTQAEGLTWLEAIKAAKNDQKTGRAGEEMKSEGSVHRNYTRDRMAKQFALEQMPGLIMQKIRPILEKRYVLVGCQGTSLHYQELPEDHLPISSDSMEFLQPAVVLLLLLSFLFGGGDSMIFRALLLVAGSLYFSQKVYKRKKPVVTEVAFKCSGVTSRSIGEVISVITDVPGRCLWDPFCVEAIERDEISLSYSSVSSLRVKQTLTRASYLEKSQCFILEKENQRLKYLFVIEDLEQDSELRTVINVYGKTVTPFAAEVANPMLLQTLLSYLHTSRPKLVMDRSPALGDTGSGDEEEGLSPGVPGESVEGMARYQGEANEALTTFKQLLEEKTGWDPISTGSAEVKGFRRQAQGGLYIIRGEATVPRPISDLVAYLKDLSRKGEYDTMFESGQVIETFPEELEVVYQRYKKQFPAKGRDLCLVQKRFDLSDGRVMAVGMSTTHPNCLENKDLVRANLFIGGFAMTQLNPTSTTVVYMTHADLGGSLPTFIVNKVQNSQALVVEGVRKALS